MSFYKKDNNVFYIYFQIIKKYNDYMEKSLGKYNFTPSEIAVLTFLANNQDRKNTAKDISAFRGLSKGIISRTVHLLISKELILTEEKPDDGRSMYLKINIQNEELIKDLKYHSVNFINILSRDIPEVDLEYFNRINNGILHKLKKI